MIRRHPIQRLRCLTAADLITRTRACLTPWQETK